MLTQRDKDFIRYWEANRLRRKKVVRQFLIGIPIGLLFVIPIVINFSSGWYRRADMEAHSADFNPVVLLVALLLIVGFTAIFYQRHRWDQYEQHYQELLARQLTEGNKIPDPTSEPAGNPTTPSLPESNPNPAALPALDANPTAPIIVPEPPDDSSNTPNGQSTPGQPG
jgi:hypothetical protein